VIKSPCRLTMEKIGILRVEDGDFDDITVPEGHILRPYVLYRIDHLVSLSP